MPEREDWVDSRSLASRNIRSEECHREHDRHDDEQCDDVSPIVTGRECRLKQLFRADARRHSNRQPREREHEPLPQDHPLYGEAVRVADRCRDYASFLLEEDVVSRIPAPPSGETAGRPFVLLREDREFH